MSKTFKISLITISCLLGLSIAISLYSILNKANIYNGVKIEGIDVGNRSKDNAEKYLKSKFNKETENPEILFIASNYSKTIKYKDLGIKYDYNKMIQEAYNVGRTGNVFVRLKDIMDISFNDKNIELKFIKDDEILSQALEQINLESSIDKKDATIRYSDGKFIVTDEVIGNSIDIEALKKDVTQSIGRYEVVEISTKKDMPQVTKKELLKVKEEIGRYSTSFGTRDLNRSYNIKRAADAIDNKLLLPGEAFSFNQATGPRSLKAGYKEATVILNGEFVAGEGGGVCQVSSTLYNALLSSELKITERHKHSLPVPYVPLGKDATVAYDYLDLKFENNYSAPVYIKSYVNGNTITFKIYGNKN